MVGWLVGFLLRACTLFITHGIGDGWVTLFFLFPFLSFLYILVCICFCVRLTRRNHSAEPRVVLISNRGVVDLYCMRLPIYQQHLTFVSFYARQCICGLPVMWGKKAYYYRQIWNERLRGLIVLFVCFERRECHHDHRREWMLSVCRDYFYLIHFDWLLILPCPIIKR